MLPRVLALSQSRLEERPNSTEYNKQSRPGAKTLCAPVPKDDQRKMPIAQASTTAPTMMRYTANGANPCFLTHARNQATDP